MNKYYSEAYIPVGEDRMLGPFEETNLKRAIRSIREKAEIENKWCCQWWVKNQNGDVVASGGRCNGERMRTL